MTFSGGGFAVEGAPSVGELEGRVSAFGRFAVAHSRRMIVGQPDMREAEGCWEAQAEARGAGGDDGGAAAALLLPACSHPRAAVTCRAALAKDERRGGRAGGKGHQSTSTEARGIGVSGGFSIEMAALRARKAAFLKASDCMGAMHEGMYRQAPVEALHVMGAWMGYVEDEGTAIMMEEQRLAALAEAHLEHLRSATAACAASPTRTPERAVRQVRSLPSPVSKLDLEAEAPAWLVEAERALGGSAASFTEGLPSPDEVKTTGWSVHSSKRLRRRKRDAAVAFQAAFRAWRARRRYSVMVAAVADARAALWSERVLLQLGQMRCNAAVRLQSWMRGAAVRRQVRAGLTFPPGRTPGGVGVVGVTAGVWSQRGAARKAKRARRKAAQRRAQAELVRSLAEQMRVAGARIQAAMRAALMRRRLRAVLTRRLFGQWKVMAWLAVAERRILVSRGRWLATRAQTWRQGFVRRRLASAVARWLDTSRSDACRLRVREVTQAQQLMCALRRMRLAVRATSRLRRACLFAEHLGNWARMRLAFHRIRLALLERLQITLPSGQVYFVVHRGEQLAGGVPPRVATETRRADGVQAQRQPFREVAYIAAAGGVSRVLGWGCGRAGDECLDFPT